MTAFCYFHTGSAICYKHLFLVLSFGKGKKQKDGFCFVLMSCFRARGKSSWKYFLKTWPHQAESTGSWYYEMKGCCSVWLINPPYACQSLIILWSTLMTSESIVHLVGVLNGEHFRLRGKLLPVSQKTNLLISVESIVLYRTVVSHRCCWLQRKIMYAVFTSIKKLLFDK